MTEIAPQLTGEPVIDNRPASLGELFRNRVAKSGGRAVVGRQMGGGGMVRHV